VITKIEGVITTKFRQSLVSKECNDSQRFSRWKCAWQSGEVKKFSDMQMKKGGTRHEGNAFTSILSQNRMGGKSNVGGESEEMRESGLSAICFKLEGSQATRALGRLLRKGKMAGDERGDLRGGGRINR